MKLAIMIVKNLIVHILLGSIDESKRDTVGKLEARKWSALQCPIKYYRTWILVENISMPISGWTNIYIVLLCNFTRTMENFMTEK